MTGPDYGLRLPATGGICGALSNQGTACERPPDHEGCHETYVNGDGRRWWGDARWPPWVWTVYAWRANYAD